MPPSLEPGGGLGRSPGLAGSRRRPGGGDPRGGRDRRSARGSASSSEQQRADGSWATMTTTRRTPAATSLVTLALLTAGEPARFEPTIRRRSTTCGNFDPEDLKSTYAVALQTMVFAAADPERDQLQIAANVAWLETGPDQARRPRRLARLVDLHRPPRSAHGDNSNTQYALLGLNAASRGRRAGRARGLGPRARATGKHAQHNDGELGATRPTTASPPPRA